MTNSVVGPGGRRPERRPLRSVMVAAAVLMIVGGALGLVAMLIQRQVRPWTAVIDVCVMVWACVVLVDPDWIPRPLKRR